MSITGMHREDVKAALRKRFGSLLAFEQARFLPVKSVHDVLRGRPNKRVQAAIEMELRNIGSPEAQTDFSDCSADLQTAHRLNAEAR